MQPTAPGGVRVVLGEAVVDLYAAPPGAPLDTAASFVPFAGGAGLNVACALARLGRPTRFLGALSLDPHGERLSNALRDAGVDTAFVQRVRAPSPLVFVSVAPDGARRFSPHRSATAETGFQFSPLAATPDAPLAGARWLLLGSDAVLRYPLSSAARWLLSACRDRGVAVAVDLNVRPSRWADVGRARSEVGELARAARVLKASVDDLRALEMLPTMEALRSLNPAADCVLTRGASGAEVCACNARWQLDAARAVSLDPTGAGDAFFAGMMSVLEPDALDARTRWDHALSVAADLAARTVEHLGATPAHAP